MIGFVWFVVPAAEKTVTVNISMDTIIHNAFLFMFKFLLYAVIILLEYLNVLPVVDSFSEKDFFKKKIER